MGRREPAPTPRGEAIKRLQRELGLEEEEIGRALGVTKKVIHNKLKGWQKLYPEDEQAILGFMRLPPEAALEISLFFGRWVRAAVQPAQPPDPEEEDLRHCERTAGLLGVHVAKAVLPVLVREMRAKRIARDRRRAARRGPLLLQLPTPREQRERIEDAEDYQTWALVEWLAEASERAAADKPARAVELAELALFIIPFVPGPDSRRRRLEGYATFILANAFRVRNDLDESDAAVQRGWALWQAGEDDDFLPLEEARLLDLEASLRRAQRRFDVSLVLLERAFNLSPAENKGRVLLKKAVTLEQAGDIETAVEVLWMARLYISERSNLRDIFGLHFNLAVSLGHLGRFSEAADLLPSVRNAAVDLGNELDLVRALWLQARVDAGLGKRIEAAAALEQVFQEFVVHELPYDAALAGLNLSILYLEQERHREVLPLAQQIKKVFLAKNVEREALAALMIFCEAARREEATVELAQQTAEIIENLQAYRGSSLSQWTARRGS